MGEKITKSTDGLFIMHILINYLSGLYRVHVTLIYQLLNAIQHKLSPTLSCRVRNLRNALSGSPARFGYDSIDKLYFVRVDRDVHYFAHKSRGFELYTKGLSVRSERLANTYCLENIDFKKNDVVIDCGANYADLWLYLRDKIDPSNYFTFEPSEQEYRSICRNAIGAQNFNLGLGDANETRHFYIDSGNADSSLIEPKHYDHEVEVEVATLDSFLPQLGGRQIHLFKLEAEGFEPEILSGAENILPFCDYVAIDGGYERGIDQEETFCQQVNFLTDRNFELVGVFLKCGRALFRNKRCANGQ